MPSAVAARELVRGELEALASEGTLGTCDVDAAFDVIQALLHGVISLQLRSVPGRSDDLAKVASEMAERGLLRWKGRNRG